MKKIIPLLASVLVLAGCEEQLTTKSEDILPKNASNITSVGNGWVTFELEFKDRTDTFLYHKSRSGNAGFEAITKIKEEKKY